MLRRFKISFVFKLFVVEKQYSIFFLGDFPASRV